MLEKLLFMAIESNDTITINPSSITIVINVVVMRRRRKVAGSGSGFSKLGILVGFMDTSFERQIDLVVNIRTAQRLDKTLAQLVPKELGISRSRVQELIISGAVSDSEGKFLDDPSSRTYFGQKVIILLPRPQALDLLPENIKLDILYEDTDLLVVNKSAGMIVHPAPGVYNGTLVNALLYHCGSSLSGIGGVKRPGIVHRIDKDTSGLLVVAKTNLAHLELAKQFFQHSAERKYLAFAYGCPSKLDRKLKQLPGVTFEASDQMKVVGNICRHKVNRKKMTVSENTGRYALTRIRVKKFFGIKTSPVASLLECKLETGRTHQIRVHLNYTGYNIIGDQTYKARKRTNLGPSKEINFSVQNFKRQALHAATLGFAHPKTNEWLSFSSTLPVDMKNLLSSLERLNESFLI